MIKDKYLDWALIVLIISFVGGIVFPVAYLLWKAL